MISRLFLSRAQPAAIQGIMNRYEQLTRTFREFGKADRQPFKALTGSLVRLASVALSVALMPAAAHANGNMVDSFTYNGNQPGFIPGSVYALSIAGTELNVCLFTPEQNTTPPNLQYNSSCQGTIVQSDTSNYTAVAYLGTYNNPNNYFAVGDGAGNVKVMQIQFNSDNPSPITLNIIQTLTIMDPDDNTSPCGQITSLAVDPDGSFLYVSCVSSKANVYWKASRGSYYGSVSGATLAIVEINSAASGGGLAQTYSTVPPAILDGSWVIGFDNSAPNSLVTAVAFPGSSASNLSPAVNPKLRAYPRNYPALAGMPAYYANGAVFYSGIVSGYSGYAPINGGIMCMGGQCQFVYNISLSDSDGGWVFTAAEYGTSQAGNPVLYWNQVQAELAGGSTSVYTPFIFKSTSNVLASCENPNTSFAITTAPCGSQNNIQWPPITVPPTIPTSNVWIDQLIFSPTPTAVSNNTSYTQGLLQISTWNNGYLAYYDVAGGSYVPGVFMPNNGANGEIGANVQGLTTDTNGNLLIQAGSSGLLGFNAFPTSATNIETQTDVTYVPIPADTNAASNCGLGCKVTQGLGIVASVVTDISVASLDDDDFPSHTQFSLHAPVAKDVRQTAYGSRRFSSSEPDAASMDTSELDGSFQIAMNLGGDMSADVLGHVLSDSVPSLLELAALSTEAADVQCCDSNDGAPNPALANFLGQKPYWGTFTYTEQQLNLLGIRRGDKIKGMQLRLAEGISAQPKQTLRFKNVQIALKSGATAPSAQTGWSYESIVFRRSLSIPRCSYNRSTRDGYGPVISFGRPYRYLGGNLTLTLRHSGSGNSKRFYLDAFEGAGVIGAYAELSSVWSQPTDVTELRVAPQIKLIKKGTSPKRVKYPSRCG